MSNPVKCPACGAGLVDLPSKNRRECFVCHKAYEWKLKPGQKSVLIKNLVGVTDGENHDSGRKTDGEELKDD